MTTRVAQVAQPTLETSVGATLQCQRAFSSTVMPNRADYQPLAQSADEEHGGNIFNSSETLPAGERQSRSLRRPSRPGPIDLSKLDAAFKRCVARIISVFYNAEFFVSMSLLDGQRALRKR